MSDQLLPNVINSAAFALLGVVLFVVAFIILDLLTPGKLWDEISVKKNTAAAILMGSLAIALGIIVGIRRRMKKPETLEHFGVFFSKCQRDVATHRVTYHHAFCYVLCFQPFFQALGIGFDAFILRFSRELRYE